MDYKIIADSCCDLTDEMKDWGNLALVPLTLELGDYRIMDDENFDQDDFIARMQALGDVPRSACPSPDAFCAAIAADNAKFGQTGPKVGSFDGGLGSSYLARIVGQKKAREIWYLCRQYDARQALDMGLVNTVVPLEDLEEETLSWCRQMLRHSPLALRCLKASLNADCDGQMGLLDLAGNATLLYYMSEEAKEGKNAFVEKRAPDFSKFPRLP